jgi:hypothetical protein
MEKKYDLQQIYAIDSMHDEQIDKIEIYDDKLVFNYPNLEYHEGYHSCKVIFIGGQYASVEVREEVQEQEQEQEPVQVKVMSTLYDLEEFVEFIREKECLVETIDYYCGLCDIRITAALVNSVGYCEHCVFTIPATELIYQWEQQEIGLRVCE